MTQQFNSPPQNSTAPAPSFLVTGTFAGLKAPSVNGVVVLSNNQLYSYTAPTSQPLQSTPLPASLTTPGPVAGLCGDLTNGVAVYAGSTVAYLTGVGIYGAQWNTLPAVPTGSGTSSSANGTTTTTAPVITAICGDLVNGLVVADGASLYSMQFNGAAPEWTLLAAPPAGTIAAIAGDPTNGVLLVMNNGAGPSSLYYSAGGCSCSWVALTAPSTNLPVTKVQVAQACGSAANGFILFGENQVLTVTVKYTAGTSSAPAVAAALQTRMPAPPFTLSDVTGDAINGCTALGGASGLIANAGSTFATWTVIGAVAAS